MRSDLKINYQVIDNLAKDSGDYALALGNIKSSMKRIKTLLDGDASDAVEELSTMYDEAIKDIKKCKTTLDGVQKVLGNFSGEMQDLIRPINYCYISRVDKDDIHFNMEQIKSSCNKIKSLRWSTSPYSVSGTMGRTLTETEKANEKRNYDKLNEIWNTIIPNAYSSLQFELDMMERLYNNKIVPYEELDDKYKDKIAELCDEYSELAWYNSSVFKAIVGVILVAAAIVVIVVTFGTATPFVAGICYGVVAGGLIGGGSSAILTTANGGDADDVFDAFADGIFWGAIGGGLAGGTGAVIAGAMSAAGAGLATTIGAQALGGSLVDTGLYMTQCAVTGEDITLGGVATTATFGIVFSILPDAVGTKLNGIFKNVLGNTDDGVKIVSKNADEVLEEIKVSGGGGDETNNAFKVEIGINGKKISIDEYQKIKILSIKNPNSDTMTLGRYDLEIVNGKKVASPTAYTNMAGNTSNFDLGDSWGEIKKQYNFTDKEMFEIFNLSVLDDAEAAGKIFRFSHNPDEYTNCTLADEWSYLQKKYDYVDTIKRGEFWYAIK